jgi:hypothetical protein
MKYLLITLIALFIYICVNAQSPFRAEPKLAYPVRADRFNKFGAVNPLTDSIVNAVRFGVTVSPAGVTFAGVYQASAGIEIEYEHQDYNYATKTYKVLWSGGIVWIPINTSVPITGINQLESVGALFGFDNDLIKIGPFINPNAPGPITNGIQQPARFKDKAGLWVAIGINLN